MFGIADWPARTFKWMSCLWVMSGAVLCNQYSPGGWACQQDDGGCKHAAQQCANNDPCPARLLHRAGQRARRAAACPAQRLHFSMHVQHFKSLSGIAGMLQNGHMAARDCSRSSSMACKHYRIRCMVQASVPCDVWAWNTQDVSLTNSASPEKLSGGNM